MNLNEQLRQAYEAGRRQALNEQGLEVPAGGMQAVQADPIFDNVPGYISHPKPWHDEFYQKPTKEVPSYWRDVPDMDGDGEITNRDRALWNRWLNKTRGEYTRWKQQNPFSDMTYREWLMKNYPQYFRS